MTAFLDMSDVRAANRAAGHHWFSRPTMRFFNSRVESPLYAGRYFVSSEQYGDDTARLYTVRLVNDDGTIETVGEFQGYATKADARQAVRDLIGGQL